MDSFYCTSCGFPLDNGEDTTWHFCPGCGRVLKVAAVGNLAEPVAKLVRAATLLLPLPLTLRELESLAPRVLRPQLAQVRQAVEGALRHLTAAPAG